MQQKAESHYLFLKLSFECNNRKMSIMAEFHTLAIKVKAKKEELGESSVNARPHYCRLSFSQNIDSRYYPYFDFCSVFDMLCLPSKIYKHEHEAIVDPID